MIPAGIKPGIAAAVCGSTPEYPIAVSPAAQHNASAEANATTRRDPDSEASSGSATSHSAAKDSIPPVATATGVMRPASASEDSTQALSSRPVRDRYQHSRTGAISQENAPTSIAPGAPRIAR